MEDIKLIHGDSLQALKGYSDNHFDVAIVDPPYGSNALDGSKTAKKYGINRTDNWDCYRPTNKYFEELKRVSRNQIIWGGNYFINDLEDTKCMIILDKSNIPDSFITMSPVELAWTSFNKPSKIYRTTTNTGNKIHPTQKPIDLYKFCLEHFTNEGDLILDTHLGSASIAIACHYMKRKLIGYEIDKEYYDAACKRFKEQTMQQALW
jgi:site-specific DNA-methyltransferase (adenine-specific)